MKQQVALAIIEKDGEYAFLKKREGNWVFPGGKVEEGGTPEDAAMRETMEESCLQIPGPFRSLPRPSSPAEAKASSVRSDFSSSVNLSLL